MKSIAVVMWIYIVIVIEIFYFANGEKIAGLILARGGSKGIHLKNLQQIGGVSLLRNTINIAKNAGLDDITVSTDHPLIAVEAYKSNASVFHRSFITATDFAPSLWGAAEFIHHRPEIDVLVLLQTTSPFTQPFFIREGIKVLSLPIAFDCVFSVSRSYKLRWQNRNGQLYSLNFDPNIRPRRQDWEGELLEAGSFYITRKHLLYKGYFQNNNCTTIEVSQLQSFEVDTYLDLQVANAIYQANLLDKLI